MFFYMKIPITRGFISLENNSYGALAFMNWTRVFYFALFRFKELTLKILDNIAIKNENMYLIIWNSNFNVV